MTYRAVALALVLLAACKEPPGGDGAGKKAEKPLPPLPPLKLDKVEARPMPPAARAVVASPSLALFPDALPPGTFAETGAAAAVVARCNQGDVTSCRDGALTYLAGNGVPADPVIGKQMLTRACDGRDGSACELLALRLADTTGPDHDPDAAVVAARRACSVSDRGCAFLGNLYQHGIGVPADPAAARDHFARACAAGNRDACKSTAK